MTGNDAETDDLLARARGGEAAAGQLLLERYRQRLGRMVALRLDRRLAARLDPADVVQEALFEASQRLAVYLEERPLPFYPWLRRLTWKRLVKLHHQHLGAQKRSVAREEHAPGLPDESVQELAERLVASGTSPSQRAVREELRARVQAALKRLPEPDREILVLRFLEQLSTSEIAAVLDLSEGAVKTRQTRALDRLGRLLGGDPRRKDS